MVARTDSKDEDDIYEDRENDSGNEEIAAPCEIRKNDRMRDPSDQQHKTEHNGKCSENEIQPVMGRSRAVTKLLARRLTAKPPDLNEGKSSHLCQKKATGFVKNQWIHCNANY